MTATTAEQGARQEIRFAVVMYGGVSLAIYINGVTQELFRLVRATAEKADGTPLFDDDALTPIEQVYREVGQAVGKKIIVDILSGTSAGGINAIFLAKALANGQDIEQLETLWIDEGDVDTLINDRKAVKGLTDHKRQKPPTSLLSSQRMYYKLVEAFDGMEESRTALDGATIKLEKPPTNHTREETPSPYVEELDLFVTTTDLEGLPVPLRLSDADVVHERRHRNVFHFRYKPHRSTDAQAGTQAAPGVQNDFHAGNNGFLAFAARCTSSFPFAFEPMHLGAIAQTLAVLKNTRPWHPLPDGGGAWQQAWRRFFPDYFIEDDYSGEMHPVQLGERAFADGGYLDNKPFSYAIDTLALRSARVPVDRKLIYIEPNPNRLNRYAPARPAPNALENVFAALTLARYEPIREDLQRVLARNRKARLLNTLVQGLDEDMSSAGKHALGEHLSSEQYAETYLDKMITKHRRGISYGGYHRLKVATLTDEVARILSKAAGFDDDSERFVAMRQFVRAWRMRTFARYQHEPGKPFSEHRFILRYDLLFRLRRLHFVLLQIDKLQAAQPTASMPDTLSENDLRTRLHEVLLDLRYTYGALHENGDLNLLTQTLLAGNPQPEPATKQKEAKLLSKMRRLIQRAFDAAPNPAEASARQKTVLHKLAQDLAIILKATEADRQAAADTAYMGNQDEYDDLFDTLFAVIKHSTKPASKRCDAAFAACDNEELARHAKRYFDHYEHYDLILFPVMQTTELGQETDHIEIIRISPDDATTIIDQQKSGVKKLAGTVLMNFGAFLDEGWRRNDILWGRLDGAERLITALLPEGHPKRSECIGRAHYAILKDAADKDWFKPKDAPEQEDWLDRAEEDIAAQPDPTQYLYDKYKAYLETFDRKPEPQPTVRAMARSTRIVGDMLEHIADDYQVSPKAGTWIARLGTVFTTLVELAVPGSLLRLFARHWLGLLIPLEVLILGLGWLLGSDAALQFGLTALLVTLLAVLGSWILGHAMAGSIPWSWVRRSIRGFFFLLLLLAGVLAFFGLKAVGRCAADVESIWAFSDLWECLLPPPPDAQP